MDVGNPEVMAQIGPSEDYFRLGRQNEAARRRTLRVR
jgi:hypothetical protein